MSKLLLLLFSAVISAAFSGCTSTPASGKRQNFNTSALSDAKKPLFCGSPIYMNWKKHGFIHLPFYMNGSSPLILNAESWNVSNDAELMIQQPGETHYQQSYGPIPISQIDTPYGFGGDIRLKKPSKESGAITVSTSYEGSSLTISPVWVKYSASKEEAVEVAYIPVSTPDPDDASEEDNSPTLVTMTHNVPETAQSGPDVYASSLSLSGTGFKFWADSQRQSERDSLYTPLPESGMEFYVEATGPGTGGITSSHQCTIVDGWGQTPPISNPGYILNINETLTLRGFCGSVAAPEEMDVMPVPDQFFPVEGASGKVRGPLAEVTVSGENLVRSNAELGLEPDEENPDNAKETTLDFDESRLELYERFQDDDGRWAVDANNDPLYRKVSCPAKIPAGQLPKILYLHPLKGSDEVGDTVLEFTAESPDGAAKHVSKAKLTLYRVDADVDSNNDGSVSQDDEEEDKIEELPPGCIIRPTLGDEDGDGIIDHQDDQIDGEDRFGELKIKLSKAFDPEKHKFHLSYDASAPSAEGGLSGSGSMRIWKKQSNQQRNPAPVSGGGDYTADNNRMLLSRVLQRFYAKKIVSI